MNLISFKKSKVVVLVISLALFFGLAQEASAAAPLVGLAIVALAPILIGVLTTVFSFGLFIIIVGGINYLAGYLINFGIALQADLLDPEKITVIQVIWETLRDFINIFFILVLVIIAFATIFDIKNYKARDLLPKLIIAALLINFSLIITIEVVKLLWIPAALFLKPLGQGISEKLANTLNIQQFFDPTWIKLIPGIGGSVGIVEKIFKGVLLVVDAFILSWITLIIWARIPILIGLMIVSPIAWLGFTFPAIKKATWTAWWEKLFCWGTIPIPLFGLIYFVIYFHRVLTQQINQVFPPSATSYALSFLGINAAQAFVWLITIGLFIGGLSYIKGLSCSMYGWVSKAFFGTWKGIRRSVGGTADLLYTARGYKGAIGQVQKRMAQEGYPIPLLGQRFGAAAREAREARREDQLAGLLGLSPAFTAQKKVLDQSEKASKDIDNKFKQATSTEDEEKIIRELKIKVDVDVKKGIQDPETLAAINSLAKRGQLDKDLFDQAVKNFKDMPLVLTKVMSEWKEGKFGGISLDNFVKTMRDEEKTLPLDARRIMYSFAASDDGKEVAKKMETKDFNTGAQVLGRSTKAGRDYFKFWADFRPTYIANYRFENKETEYSKEDLEKIKTLQDAIRAQVQKASVKDFSDYFHKEWTDKEKMDDKEIGERFKEAVKEVLKEKDDKGTARKFIVELRRKLRREGKDAQFEELNKVVKDMGIEVKEEVVVETES